MLAEHLHEHLAQQIVAHHPVEAYGAGHVSGGGFYRTLRWRWKRSRCEDGIGGGDRKCRTTGGSHGLITKTFFSVVLA